MIMKRGLAKYLKRLHLVEFRLRVGQFLTGRVLKNDDKVRIRV